MFDTTEFDANSLHHGTATNIIYYTVSRYGVTLIRIAPRNHWRELMFTRLASVSSYSLLGYLCLVLVGCGSNVTTAETGDGKVAEPTGPQPKAVIESAVHQLGNIQTHTSHSHTFVIRNEGDAPLTLKNNGTTCQCTLSDLEDVELQPGESKEITLTWTPDHPTDNFSKGADIGTSDPKRKTIALRGEGKVYEVIDVLPSGAWPIGDLKKDEPTPFGGTILSKVVDSFEIVEMTADSSLVELNSEKIEDEEKLNELGAKSAYRISGTIKPGVPIGEFVSILNFEVKTDKNTDVKIEIRGRRPGPYLVTGPGWVGEYNLVDFKKFSAEEGKTVKLTMYLDKDKEATEPLKIIEQTADPSFVSMEIEPAKFDSPVKDAYTLTFKIPPKTPPTTLSRNNFGKLKLKTNHPVVTFIMIQIKMQSY